MPAAPPPPSPSPPTARAASGEFDWSPDSTRIAFAATPNPLLAQRSDSDLYLVERARPETRSRGGRVARPRRCAPCSHRTARELAFETALGEPYHYYANTHVATVRLADVAARPARAAARRPRSHVLTSTRTPASSAGARTGIFISALRRTDAHLFRIPAAGGLVRVSAPDRLAVSAVSLSRDFKTAAFLIASATAAPRGRRLRPRPLPAAHASPT